MQRRVLWTAMCLAALCGVLTLRAVAAEPAACQCKVLTDRPDALYAAGEKVRFAVTVQKNGKAVTEGKATYLLSIDGAKQLAQGELDLAHQPMVVEGSLAEPGFLQCRVVYVGPNKAQPVVGLGGAGVDPLKIQPSMPVPADFDAFWAAQRAKLAAVPLKPVLTPVTWADKTVECFDVQIPCVGKSVSGYFARPVGAKPKSLPAVLHVQGAGVRSSSLGGAATWAKQYNVLSLDINAHGLPNGKPPKFYEDLKNGALKGYPKFGNESRESCYFLGMFLRVMRALDFLKAQPEWDGKILAVEGSSQGGGQSIAAAGLDPCVTFFAPGVPAICDHTGAAIGRINGWPKLVPNDAAGKPDPKILQVARYFDCVNFATRTKAEAIFSVGFIDTTCAPTSVYAAYNQVSGKKQIVNCPLMGHASSPAVREAFGRAFAEYLKRAK